MTTVLLAIDDTDDSHAAAVKASELFGPDATYLALHVGTQPVEAVGTVYGYSYPSMPPPALPTDVAGDPERRDDAVERARAEATKQAQAAGVDATPVGDVGDPAVAIARVATEHGADVVVVGSHDRSWFWSLLERSTTDGLLDLADCPVLVVPPNER